MFQAIHSRDSGSYFVSNSCVDGIDGVLNSQKTRLINQLKRKIDILSSVNANDYVKNNWKSIYNYDISVESNNLATINNVASTYNKKLGCSAMPHGWAAVNGGLNNQQAIDAFPATRYDVWLESKNIRYIPYGSIRNLTNFSLLVAKDSALAGGRSPMIDKALSIIKGEILKSFEDGDGYIHYSSCVYLTCKAEPEKKFTENILCTELAYMQFLQNIDCGMFDN